MLQKTSSPYRLGLDLGANSLGWFLVWLDENRNTIGLGPGGVRVFADGRDPQSKTSNAVTRRMARGARRRRNRYLARRERLMQALVRRGLMPEDRQKRKALEALDPYALRAAALDTALPLHHLGRAIFHLNQRRGFQSNRKTDNTAGEDGAIKQAARRLDEAMEEAGARTLGEFLHQRRQQAPSNHKMPPVRVRNTSASAKAEYAFYPTRQHLLDEFRRIWQAQAHHHAALTEQARAEIEGIVFFQRPLKRPPIGKCSVNPARDKDDLEGFRCPWSHPLAQRFRIWQEINNLEIQFADGTMPRRLTPEERQTLFLLLTSANSVTFEKIRKQLGLPSDSRFNLESEKRDKLKGDETAEKLAKRKLFGKTWRALPLEHQIEIVHQLEEEEDEGRLIAWLIDNCALDAETAERVANATLPQGHTRFGLRAICNILPNLEKGMVLHDAAQEAYPHYNRPTGELSQSGYLPYYGEWLQDAVVGSGDVRDRPEVRYGRFPNPTVHIGLGQLRRQVNAIIRRYGPPQEITLEMTRDFRLSPRQVSELEREQAKHQRRNEERARLLQEHGLPVNAGNLLRLRLWEELEPLERCCVYSGEPIPFELLFSEEVDVDHILPFSRTWDDSAANKVLCRTAANRDKGNRTPYEAWGRTPAYDDIIARAMSLPKNKQWRFRPDAMDRYEKEGGFLARQLNETSWLSRLARQYLTAVTGDIHKVNVLPGRMTAMLRGKWGMNSLLPDHNFSDAKNRKDHRHHAIDACVAAVTDRKLLHRVANANSDESRERLVIPEPWEGFRDELKARLETMTVYHKPDHGLRGRNGSTSGKLHEDTAYGLVKEPEKEDGATIVYRRPFMALRPNEVAAIRDRRLRELLLEHIHEEKQLGHSHEEALASFVKRVENGEFRGLPGIRHVRITKREKLDYAVPIRDASGKVYKAYSAGDNAFVDIYEDEKGIWRGEAVSVFKANQPGMQPEWMTLEPRPRHIMRIFKNDMISVVHEGERKIFRVVRLVISQNLFYLVEHNQSGNFQKRHEDKEDPFRWYFGNYEKLRQNSAYKVRVDDLGTVWRVESPFNGK